MRKKRGAHRPARRHAATRGPPGALLHARAAVGGGGLAPDRRQLAAAGQLCGHARSKLPSAATIANMPPRRNGDEARSELSPRIRRAITSVRDDSDPFSLTISEGRGRPSRAHSSSARGRRRRMRRPKTLLAALASLRIRVTRHRRRADRLSPSRTAIVDAMNEGVRRPSRLPRQSRQGRSGGGQLHGRSGRGGAGARRSCSTAADPGDRAFLRRTGSPTCRTAQACQSAGMAIKYHLPDGSDTDMVINSAQVLPGFHRRGFPRPAAGGVAATPDAAKPTKLTRSWLATPAPAAFATVTPRRTASPTRSTTASTPSSSSTRRGTDRPCALPDGARARRASAAGGRGAKMPPNFLMDELPQRLKQASRDVPL